MPNHMFTSASIGTISGGTFINYSEKSVALDRLSAAAAYSAMYDAPVRTDESRCYQDTRTNVLDNLERWAQGICDEGASILWLHGGAGAGKSAIMQSLAERFIAQSLVLGSFFFSRSDPARNSAEVLIPTLVYQLAQLFPSSMDILSPLINREPLIFKKSFQVQLLSLLVHPLQHLVQLGFISNLPQTPRVFLIDGLDECSDSAQQQAIILAFATVCDKHCIPVKFLIASRPEHAISTSFCWYAESNRALGTMSLSDDPDSAGDIQRFIEDQILKIRLQHPFKRMLPSEWPNLYDINRLVWKSSSHFIYASTAMKYIWSAMENPARSLQVVLGLEVSRTISPFDELDRLYHHILCSAAHLDTVLQIIAHCLFSRLPSSPGAVSVLLNVSKDDLFLFLADITSLVKISKNQQLSSLSAPKDEVNLLHASLGDFLRNKSRSGSLYIDEAAYLASKLEICFQLLDLHCGEQPTRPDWLEYDSHTHGRDYPHFFLLTSQVLKTIQKSGHLVATQEILTRYSLLRFYQWRLSVKDQPSGMPGVLCDLVKFFLAVHSIETPEGVALFRHPTEDFLKIFDTDISLKSTPLAGAVFTLICMGHPEKRSLCMSLSFHLGVHHWGHDILIGTYELEEAFDAISTADLTSIRHSVNTSPKRLAVAAAAILSYIMNDISQLQMWHYSSTCLEHKAWLQRIKPGKHVATGAPMLSSRFRAQCVKSLRLLEDPAYDIYAGDRELMNVRLRATMFGVRYRRPSLAELEWQQGRLGVAVSLLNGLLWVLPNACFSAEIVRYSKRVFPQIMYERKAGLICRVRKSLDEYVTRVNSTKLKELDKRIEDGNVKALAEKLRMLYLDAQD